MTKFAKYDNALEFAKTISTQNPASVFLLIQTGAAEFCVMTEAAYQHSIVCARLIAGANVGWGVQP